MNNYATLKTDKVRAWLAARPRYTIHFTPTSASWLNLVERFFSMLSEKWIKRQAHVSVKDLEASIKHHLETYYQNPKHSDGTRKQRTPSLQSLVQHECSGHDFLVVLLKHHTSKVGD
ncbi:hypothetical protein D3C76_1272240 [compost metagenome]